MKAKDVLFWLGVAFLIVLGLGALFVPMFGPGYSKYVAPPFSPMGTGGILGTDRMGQDIFVRLMYGARISISIGLAVQAISVLVGITFGTLGVYGPKAVRTTVMRFTDAMFAFPDILLAILIIAIKGPGQDAVILALTITSWPGVTRLVYSQISSLKDREYVAASRAMGASVFYVVRKHVLPQIWGILLAVTMVDLAGTILAESTLSFLGIGVQPPMPSWGSMLDNARPQLQNKPMLLLWPCLALSLTIFALNFVGDGLRARLDPKNK